jgi:outer membrane protein
MKKMHSARQGWQRLGICAALVWSGCAFAQTTNLKIGYVDAEAILLQAPQTQGALRTLQDEFAPRQRSLVALQTELQEKQATYERDAEVMGQGERASLERDLRDGARDLQRKEQEFQEDLNIRRNELLAVAQRAVSEQIATYATSNGYDLILQNAVYQSESVNITADVLTYLQATPRAGSGGN